MCPGPSSPAAWASAPQLSSGSSFLYASSFFSLHGFACLTTLWALRPEHARAQCDDLQCLPVKCISSIKTMLGGMCPHGFSLTCTHIASTITLLFLRHRAPYLFSYSPSSLIHCVFSAFPFPLPRMSPALCLNLLLSFKAHLWYHLLMPIFLASSFCTQPPIEPVPSSSWILGYQDKASLAILPADWWQSPHCASLAPWRPSILTFESLWCPTVQTTQKELRKCAAAEIKFLVSLPPFCMGSC